MMGWLSRIFTSDSVQMIKEYSLELDRSMDKTVGVHEDAIQRIKRVTSRVTLAQSGNCKINKLLKEIGH